jgi:hypothetical protein
MAILEKIGEFIYSNVPNHGPVMINEPTRTVKVTLTRQKTNLPATRREAY